MQLSLKAIGSKKNPEALLRVFNYVFKNNKQ